MALCLRSRVCRVVHCIGFVIWELVRLDRRFLWNQQLCAREITSRDARFMSTTTTTTQTMSGHARKRSIRRQSSSPHSQLPSPPLSDEYTSPTRRPSYARAPPSLKNSDYGATSEPGSGRHGTDEDESEHKFSGWHYIPLIFALVPPLGAIVHGRAEAWTDMLMLVVIAFCAFNFADSLTHVDLYQVVRSALDALRREFSREMWSTPPRFRVVGLHKLAYRSMDSPTHDTHRLCSITRRCQLQSPSDTTLAIVK